MSKPTPGPWTIEDDASECVVSRDPEANEFHIVARTHGPDDEANARLISAAPDLLAVCISLVEGIELRGLETGWHHDPGMLTKARAAIAKAEGEGVS